MEGAADEAQVAQALAELRSAARCDDNIMPASIRAAKAGVTTGEWADVMREAFGEYRAPTGVPATARQIGGDLDGLRERVQALAHKLGRRPAILIGKPASMDIPMAPSRSPCAARHWI